MRLAFCNATRRWGGVKTWTVEFAAALQARGHACSIYGRDETFLARAKSEGLEAVKADFGFDYNPAAVRRFHQEFAHRRIQAVLVNVGKDLRTAGLAARIAGLPLVQRIGLPGDMKNSLKVRLTHSLLTPRYLCPCYFIRDGLLRNLPFIRENDTAVVYSAKTPLAEAPATCGSPLRILSSSQVNANKGHAELARTLHLLRRQGLSFAWHVAGAGKCLDDLKRLCSGLGLDDAVTFHGFVGNLAPLLRNCDVFVLSSYTEGLPNTLLEALANGLVPVARDVGGVKECWPAPLPFGPIPFAGHEKERDWFAPGEYRPDDLPLLGPLRRVLTASPAELLLWKRQSWEHCRDRFSLSIQAAKLEEFFQRLIAAVPLR